MTIRQALTWGAQALAAVPDPALDAEALLSHVMCEPPMQLRLKAQQSLTPQQEERFRALLLLRTQREPLHYVLGERCFYGYDFQVDGRVLIPRQETETLCELALARLAAQVAPRVLDVCTGSGAIAVVLKREAPHAEVTATDLSEGALAVARANATRLTARVRFAQGDLLAPVAGERFTLLVSNPPYIPAQACETLQPEVLREPRLALDGGADGLIFYGRFAVEAKGCLVPGGWMLLEVGDGQAQAVSELLLQAGGWEDIAAHRDLYGALRVVEARRAAAPA